MLLRAHFVFFKNWNMSQNLTTTSTINVIDGADTTWVLNSSALVFITVSLFINVS
jgi:hypothetical protein